jgi:hypothetical protein
LLLAENRPVHGQATAQISGTVPDQSGAVLPGVEVSATQTATGIVRMAVSNETGSFALSLGGGCLSPSCIVPGHGGFDSGHEEA